MPKFTPAKEYVRVRKTGAIYARTGVWEKGTNRSAVDILTPKQAADAQAKAGIDGPLARHFKKKVRDRDDVVAERINQRTSPHSDAAFPDSVDPGAHGEDGLADDEHDLTENDDKDDSAGAAAASTPDKKAGGKSGGAKVVMTDKDVSAAELDDLLG